MEEKELKILDRVSSEIQKIENKENNIYFFVIDSKGTPSGELEYIYKIALYLKTIGYNVTMLHQEENFVGVKDWLGEEYANIQHENISNGNVNVGVSDLLIIPELFATVMNQTKKLPCKRIALLQNLNYVSEFTPLSVQWGDYGIMECIANSKQLAEKIKEWFPYVKTSVINPYIDTTLFHNTIEPKKLIINILGLFPTLLLLAGNEDEKNINLSSRELIVNKKFNHIIKKVLYFDQENIKKFFDENQEIYTFIDENYLNIYKNDLKQLKKSKNNKDENDEKYQKFFNKYYDKSRWIQKEIENKNKKDKK